ncbi:hypothetical protein, partial [Pseudomonas sp. RIT-PI-q]|uniref:hypothetical protein n=1 Tax=Pseudomonas sp. RIT-PI-q TaxID=1690247 RepID=UPI001F3C0628
AALRTDWSYEERFRSNQPAKHRRRYASTMLESVFAHSGPGAATAASLPRCPLRNACVWPLGKGQQIKIKNRSNGKIKS